VFEKILLKIILNIIAESKVLPDSQFGFRTKHFTIHQIHRIVDKISFSLEEKQYCTGAFLDISQAFDRVWHAGLLFKLKLILPSTYYLILKSYLEDRFFSVRYGSSNSLPKPINAGVPQGAVTAPLLFNIFVSDQPTLSTNLIADFADDKAILTNNHDPSIASSHIQEHLSLLEKWYKEWGVKINESKSIQCTFTLRKGICPPITLNEQILPTAQSTRYLCIIID
jgi:retron-type reverse transcriptase